MSNQSRSLATKGVPKTEEHKAKIRASRLAYELRRLHALNEDLLALAHQYANDMRYPPTADSRQRRLAAVEAVLAKVKS